MISSAVLFVDCRCTLGEGILWWPDRQSLLWTDIERSTLWMHDVRNSVTRHWSVPDRLGSFAICESGRLLLGVGKKPRVCRSREVGFRSPDRTDHADRAESARRESTTAGRTARGTSCSAR